MAKMLASGKALSLLKPYNPGTPGGGPVTPTSTAGVSVSAAAAKVGVGANGQTVADPSVAAGKAMGGAAAAQVAATQAWDFKNKKFVQIAKPDPNKFKDGYVQDEKTPGKYVLQTKSEYADGVNTFATKAEANKKKTADVESVVWNYNAAANEGVFEFKYKSGSAMKPVTSILDAKSTYSKPQTMTVSNGKFFNLPPGAYYYGHTKTKDSYTIKFGAQSLGAYGQTTSGSGYGALPAAMGTTYAANEETFKASGKTGTTAAVRGKAVNLPVAQFAMGGVVPQGFELGGGIFGTDTVPAMLTPGEFVIKKSAVDAIGVDKLGAMNNGTSMGESVYNYSITVNATGNMDANDLARKVMEQIKQVDSQRMRSNNY
jgi:hypothetical protein